ncbi:MAG: RNA ligase (ATP) [Catalinimonas sp.]
MRKLASIQKIKALTPIAGADAIESASVLGWQLVVKKGEFAVGDLCVYCEIDSVLPDRPEFAFLKPRGMRIKTIRLRGQISQGICFPLSVLPGEFEVAEGADCTEALGVTKWEPAIPAYLSGQIKGGFPSRVPKTDETRVQVLQPLLDQYAGETCYVTEKLDGSSVTYFVQDGTFGVCSRNLELREDAQDSFWKVARALDVERKLRSLGGNVALQGELVGQGIQKNRLRLKGQTAYFFNLFDIDRYVFADYERLRHTLQDLDLPMVPVLANDYRLQNDVDALVLMATTRSALCPQVWAEGIVVRPVQERFDIQWGRVSFKAINPEFLLKHGV